MKILRLLVLVLILWNLPSIALFTVNESLGSLLSYVTISLLAIYFLFETKTKPNWWIIILSFLYFIISGFQYYGPTDDFVFDLIKYFIFVIGAYALVKKTNKESLFVLLIIGAISVAIEAMFFPTKFGRYSGFYLNPNEAGFVCIYGYALAFSLKNTSIKLLGQFVFTLMGLLTFSRTFIIIWIVLNLMSLRISIRNVRVLGIGFLLFSSLIFIDEFVGLNNPRFDQLMNIVSNKNVSTTQISEDSRMGTWAKFYDDILDAPIFGNGYGTFTGNYGDQGVHNSYLMVIGEAGIIPFLILLAYIIYLLYWSAYFFKNAPFLLMQATALALFLLTDHNFFSHYYVVFAAMWIQYQIVKEKKLRSETDIQLDHEQLET